MKIFLKFILCFSLQISVIFSSPIAIDMKLQQINEHHSNNSTFSQSNLKQEVLTLKHKICMSNPNKCFNLVYDTASFHLSVPSKGNRCIGSRVFNKTYAKPHNNYRDPHQWIHYIASPLGFTASDNVEIENSVEDDNLHFSVDEVMEDYDGKCADGILGFGRDYAAEAKHNLHNEKNNSILEAFKKSGLINRKVFSQKFTNEDKTEAKLFIGDLHEDFVNNTNVTSCGVVTKDPWSSKDKVADMWSCRLSHVILGDNSAKNFERNAIPIYSSAVFDSSTNFILAPFSEIGPFRNYLEARNCTSSRDPSQGTTVFWCENPQYKEQINISFVLNGTAYNIPPSDMFVRTYSLVIINIFFVENLDHWVLGQNFMKNLHILFNSDENYVSFIPLDSRYVSDVSSFTTDADFVLCDYYQFIFLFMFVVIITAFVSCLVRMRKSRKEEKTSIIGNVTYALIDAQKA